MGRVTRERTWRDSQVAGYNREPCAIVLWLSICLVLNNKARLKMTRYPRQFYSFLVAIGIALVLLPAILAFRSGSDRSDPEAQPPGTQIPGNTGSKVADVQPTFTLV